MLGHGFWQRRFGGRADALNARIELNGRPFTIVGVLPERSALPPDTEVFTPLGFSEGDRRLDQARWLEVFGRLQPGVTAGQARAELAAISARAGQERPGRRGWTVEMVPLLEATVGPAARWLWSLLGAVGFLLVLACANVGHLLLVRTGARGGELAVRLALGARGRRIIGQLLIESVLLAAAGWCRRPGDRPGGPAGVAEPGAGHLAAIPGSPGGRRRPGLHPGPGAVDGGGVRPAAGVAGGAHGTRAGAAAKRTPRHGVTLERAFAQRAGGRPGGDRAGAAGRSRPADAQLCPTSGLRSRFPGERRPDHHRVVAAAALPVARSTRPRCRTRF